MATVKYDLSDVEAGGGGEQPKPAVYAGKIRSVTDRAKQGKDDFEVVIDIGEGYAPLWTYINYKSEPARWKFRELVDALDLPAKGSFDPAKLAGKKVNVVVVGDEYMGEYKARVKRLLKPGESEVTGESASGDGDGGEDYSTWTDDDLKAELAERELEVSGRWTTDKAIAVLEEDDAAKGDGDGGNGDGEPEADRREEYEGWDNDDLKAEIKDRGIEGNISGRFSKEKAIQALLDDDAGPQGGAAADGDAPQDDYDTWTLDDLKQEVEDRNKDGAEITISGRASMEKLIAALRKDDAENPI